MAQENTMIWKIAVIFGWHRLFSGEVRQAIIFYLTGGGLLVWWIMDIVAMFKGTYFEKNRKRV